MTTMSSFEKTDLVDDWLAALYNQNIAATLRAEYANIETLTATKELANSDTPFQVLTASTTDQIVELAPENTSNHATAIYHSSTDSYNLIVKDDSGATTLATLSPNSGALFLPYGGTVWEGVGGAPAASDTVAGIQENATSAEVSTGSSSVRTVTPDALRGSDYGKADVGAVLFNDQTAVTTHTLGTDNLPMIPISSKFDGWNIINVTIRSYDKGITGTTDVQVARRRAGANASVLSTIVTMADEWFAEDGVVDAANDDLATGDALIPYVIGIHSGTAPNGLSVVITLQKP